MNNLPIFISILFILTTVSTVLLFYKATNNSKKSLFFILAWLVFQAILGYNDFYLGTKSMPPRFLVAVLPTVIVLIYLFTNKKSKNFIATLNQKYLLLLHVVRIPVEIVLFFLFMYKTIPQSMTFEGINFDIISGITAPLIYYLFFVKKTISKKLFIAWNFLCLILVLNVVIVGVLSAPLPFQQFAFNQPNIAVLYFPFLWLPSFIVPVVIFSHFALLKNVKN